MDDTFIWLHHDNLHWYLTEFQHLGLNWGLHLSLPKTSILTTMSGSSMLDTNGNHVPDMQTGYHQDCLSELARVLMKIALALLASPHQCGPSEITTGAQPLGVPFGYSTFCSTYLATHLHTHQELQ
jgi:hypothetical protein